MVGPTALLLVELRADSKDWKMVVNWVVRLEPGMVESKAAMSVALLVVQ